MVILAQVNGIQIGAILRYRRRQKKVMTIKILYPTKLYKVNVIIDSEF